MIAKCKSHSARRMAYIFVSNQKGGSGDYFPIMEAYIQE